MDEPRYCLLWIDHWSTCLTPAEWASWVQALGSVGAIAAGFVLLTLQLRSNAQAAKLAELKARFELCEKGSMTWNGFRSLVGRMASPVRTMMQVLSDENHIRSHLSDPRTLHDEIAAAQAIVSYLADRVHEPVSFDAYVSARTCLFRAIDAFQLVEPELTRSPGADYGITRDEIKRLFERIAHSSADTFNRRAVAMQAERDRALTEMESFRRSLSTRLQRILHWGVEA
jgi:hypothetical protein